MSTLIDQALLKETFTSADITALEERAVAELYKAKRTGFKYRRNLQASLRDAPRPNYVFVQPVVQGAAIGVFGGFIFAAGAMALFFGLLWVISQAVR